MLLGSIKGVDKGRKGSGEWIRGVLIKKDVLGGSHWGVSLRLVPALHESCTSVYL